MDKWTTVIKPKARLFDLNIKEIWNYKDLIWMFVKRDFATLYKQTILGPLWIIINPLLTTIIFTVVFGGIANIPTDGIPQFVFYMAGNTLWGYFSGCITKTSATFTGNAAVFGKVYFPRMATPISTVISGLVSFLIQFMIFLGFIIYYVAQGDLVQPNLVMLLTPMLLIQTAMLGMGCGVIISALTTKYRDLGILVTFGVQLWMYATPIVYPVSQIPEKYRTLLMLNPMAPIIEIYRYGFLGSGYFPVGYLGISLGITIIIFFVGIIMFNRVEKTFMDTV